MEKEGKKILLFQNICLCYAMDCFDAMLMIFCVKSTLMIDFVSRIFIPRAFMPRGIQFWPWRLSVHLFVCSFVRLFVTFSHVHRIYLKVFG